MHNKQQSIYLEYEIDDQISIEILVLEIEVKSE